MKCVWMTDVMAGKKLVTNSDDIFAIGVFKLACVVLKVKGKSVCERQSLVKCYGYYASTLLE